ncbi:unnamed protein product [Cuscuta europaea]|uniref:Uncharacterized protein n=1 Tax=Cuscuta europaea TaxID=41803 RepID=A0A9P0Z6K3_CUSEU|nr:unnamed protein product [Cuscuta europaea]
MARMGAKVIVVFDFDKTIIEVDSDNWVVDRLDFTPLFNHLLPTMPWNSLMDKMMNELHANGKTAEDVEEVLKRVPVHPRIVPTIQSLSAIGCDLRIVSDANLFFIETILKHHGIRECFSEIKTNPGYVDKEGRVRIIPYHDFHISSHGCNNLCPPNMCKGKIIEGVQDSLASEGEKRIIYLGDGVGDFCPSLKLKEGDFVMPRKFFPVWKLINENRKLVKAEIHEWTDGEELELVLLRLINKIYIEEDNQLLPVETLELQAIHILSHDTISKAIPVPF